MADIRNDPKVQQNMAKIRDLLMNPKVTVFFVASTWLKEQIAKGEHPLVQGIPDLFKIPLLSGDGLRMQKRMVLDWLNGTLDEKNSFILSNGDIRVSEDASHIISSEGEVK